MSGQVNTRFHHRSLQATLEVVRASEPVESSPPIKQSPTSAGDPRPLLIIESIVKPRTWPGVVATPALGHVGDRERSSCVALGGIANGDGSAPSGPAVAGTAVAGAAFAGAAAASGGAWEREAAAAPLWWPLKAWAWCASQKVSAMV